LQGHVAARFSLHALSKVEVCHSKMKFSLIGADGKFNEALPTPSFTLLCLKCNKKSLYLSLSLGHAVLVKKSRSSVTNFLLKKLCDEFLLLVKKKETVY
jgi:hypothetical protein